MPDVHAALLGTDAPARGDAERSAIHDEDGGLSHRALMVVLVPLMLVLFIATLDQTIVATTIPSIADHLGDRSSASWIATAYLLTSAVTTLIFGKLGDMYGRKKIFQFSVIVFLIGSTLSGLAPSMGALIAFRALQGVGGGGLSSLVQAITGDLIPARRRAKYQAYMGITATLGIVAGPLLGGAIADGLSWRWIFYINIPIGLVALVRIAARLHLPVRRSNRSVDYLGGALAAAATTTMLLVAVWGGQTYSWTSPTIIGLIAASVIILGLYVFVERRAAEPITPLHLFRSSIFSISSALFCLATLVLFVGMLYVPSFMQTVHHYDAFQAGLFLIPLVVGLIAAAAISGGQITRTGRYKGYPVVGAVLSGAGMFVLSIIHARTPTWLLIIVLVIVGVGLGFFVQVALLAGQNAVEGQYLGVATGTLNFSKSIGGAFGAAIFGAILTAQLHAADTVTAVVSGYNTVFFGCVPIMAIALILALRMRETPLSEEMIAVAAGEIDAPEY
jgi:EmrB/QacA subfamily drug resistance transporter